MGDMIIVPPDESWMFAPVSGTAVDTTFQQSWLTDGAPDTPVQGTGLALTVTPETPFLVDVVAIINHNMQVASTITLGGNLTGSIAAPAWGRDGLPKNWYKRYTTPIMVTTATLTTAQIVGKSVIGEFYGGKGYTLNGFLRSQSKRDPGQPFNWEGEGGQRAPYDPLVSKPRRLSGSIALTDAEVETLIGWDEATHRGTRPPLLIPDSDVNDCWLVQWNFTIAPNDGYNLVNIEFVEIPRNHWDA